MPRKLIHEELTQSVIGAFFEVYNILRFGFLEHIYVNALERELLSRGHRVGREVGVYIMYKGEDIGKQRLDMIVNDVLVVEVKSTITLHPTASRQLNNYLRATSLEAGLLLHFGPEAKFYRQVLSNKYKGFSVPDPPNRLDQRPTDMDADDTHFVNAESETALSSERSLLEPQQ